jgi:hypothetical protein
MEEQHFRHISCWMNLTKKSIQASLMFQYSSHDCTVVPIDTKFTRGTLFLPQKTVTMLFPADCILSNFFFLQDVAWCHSINFHLDSGSKWWTKISSPGRICDMKPSPPATLMQKISSDCFPCLFVCVCQDSWHQASTNLVTAKLFNNCQSTAFNDKQHEA